MGSLVPGWGARMLLRARAAAARACALARRHPSVAYARAAAPLRLPPRHADGEALTAEEHARISVFKAQLEAARAASPPAAAGAAARAHAADEDTPRRGRAAETSSPSRGRSSSLPPVGGAERARRRSLPPKPRASAPAAHHFVSDDIAWWRSSETGALNAPQPQLEPRTSRGGRGSGGAEDNRLEAERIADAVRARRDAQRIASAAQRVLRIALGRSVPAVRR